MKNSILLMNNNNNNYDLKIKTLKKLIKEISRNCNSNYSKIEKEIESLKGRCK